MTDDTMILKAAREAAAVRVKALEWDEYEHEGDIDRWDAEAGGFHVYYAIELHHDGYRAFWDGEAFGPHDTLEAAKAACQADFEARIRSAIEPAPERAAIVKHMVDRFLQWRLPETFRPDAGISFVRSSYNGAVYPMPVGTNLFDAGQATAMVEFMLAGIPAPFHDAALRAENERLRDALEATRVWFGVLVDEIDLDPDDTSIEVSASGPAGKRPLAKRSMREIFEQADAALRGGSNG